jgi:hypothetical protein
MKFRPRLGARPIQLMQSGDSQTQARTWTTEYGSFRSVPIVANQEHGIVVWPAFNSGDVALGRVPDQTNDCRRSDRLSAGVPASGTPMRHDGMRNWALIVPFGASLPPLMR